MSNPWDEKPNEPFLPMAIMLAATFFLGYYVQAINWESNPVPDDDKQEQVDPAPVLLEGVSIVCVVENKTISADETIFFRDKEEFAKKHGLRMILRLDKDLSASEPYIAEAMKKNIEVPFAAYVKNKDIYKVIPLPKTKEELLK